MRIRFSLVQRRNQKSARQRRFRVAAARRTRRLWAEALEPRWVLAQSAAIQIQDFTLVEPNRAWEPNEFVSSGMVATVTVTRTGTPTEAELAQVLEVNWGYTGTANEWDFYAASTLYYGSSGSWAGPGFLQLGPGEMSRDFYFGADFDGAYENDETMSMDFYFDNSVIGHADFTIEDNSQWVTLTANESEASVSEGGSATFTLTRHNWQHNGIGVLLEVSGSPTLTWGDYLVDGEIQSSLNFGRGIGDGEESYTFTLSPKADCLYEGNETITLTLVETVPGTGRATGVPNGQPAYKVATTQTASITILDDDFPPQISIGDGGGQEGTAAEPGIAMFPISVQCATEHGPFEAVGSELPLTISYSTYDDPELPHPATAGQDYESTATNAEIANFQVPRYLSVPLRHDTLDEYDEQFYVTLTSAQFGNGQSSLVLDNQALGTIYDNDVDPQINISNVVVYEKDLVAQFVVSLTFATPNDVAAAFSMENGSAVSPSDYTGRTGTVSFSPGETSKTISVPIVDDPDYEGTESFSVRLSSLTNAKAGNIVGTGTILDGATTNPNDNNNDKPEPVPPSCTTCSTSRSRDLINTSAPGVGSSFASPGFSKHPVRYADGTVLVTSTDIEMDSFGMPWGITRSSTNGSGYAPPNIVGKGMVISEQPYLRSFDDDNEIAVITNGYMARYFNLVAGEYKPQFFLQERLEWNENEGEFVLTDTSGAKIRFYDFSANHLEAQRGQFKSYEGPDEQLITTTYEGGKLTAMLREHVEATAAVIDLFEYTYVASGDNAGLLSSVAYKRQVNGAAWTTRQTVTYAYYGSNEEFGNLGDLKTATVTAGGGSDTTYYRYYQGGDPNGYAHGLKFVFYPASYARLTAEVANATAAADTVVDDYADHYFEYGLAHRATKEIAQGAGCSTCSAGLGSFTYEYYDRSEEDENYLAGPNSWAMQTIETLPDGNQNIVYTNGDGQVMLELYVEAPNTANEKKWGTFYRYDEDGRVVFRADPAAVSGYNESLPDLVGFNAANNTATHLRDASGLITGFSYYDEEDTGLGAALGYLKEVQVREGDMDETPTTQSAYTYVERTINGQSTFFVWQSTVFANDDETGALTTEFTYAGANRIEQITTQDPTGAATTVVYDIYGRPTWTKDAAGFIHAVVYEFGTDAIEQIITDIDTSQIIGEPSGWTTPSGGGAHIRVEYAVDTLNRPTLITDPNGNLTQIAYNNTTRQTTLTPEIGPMLVTRDDRGLGYVESYVFGSGLESLSRTYFNKAGQATHADDYFNLAGLNYSAAVNVGTENVHFYRTTFAYDQRGRMHRVQRPDGTIYRTVYDGLGRPVSEWIGSDDTGWTNTSGAAGMTRMALYKYDENATPTAVDDIGDSHLTNITDALGRITRFEYDYLGRVTKVTLPDPDLTAPNDIPDYETTYDNLGRVKTQLDPLGKVTAYAYGINTTTHTTTVTVTLPDPDAAGDLQSPVVESVYDARGLLISQSDPEQREVRYAYDGAGRLISVTQVNPGEPESNWPQTSYEYDAAGNLRFITDPMQHTTERVYDELNRLIDVYAPDPDGPENPLQSPHTHYAYDAAGRLLSLTDPAGNATTWFYDALGRVTQETNQIGHSRYFEYDAAGRLERRIDRLGRVIEFDYNTLDQVMEERWYADEQAETPMRTLTHEYDAAGQLRGASDPAAAYDYLPDGLGRLKAETQTIAGFTGGGASPLPIEFTSTYTKAGSRNTLTAVIGVTGDFRNDYAYDHLQRLTSLTQTGQGPGGNAVTPKRVEFAYNAAGQFDTIGRYADAQGAELVANTFYKYDSLGRLESMIHSEDAERPESGWGAGVLAGYIYIYDAASRLWQVNSRHVVDATNVDENSVYSYDNTNQLTVASHDAQPSEVYTYDANGNRTGGRLPDGAEQPACQRRDVHLRL